MSLRLSVFPSLASILFVVSGAVACGGGGDDDDGDGVNAECMEATQHSDLAWIQENIFNGSCALSAACHRGDAPDARGLSLEEGMSEANLVGVPAEGPTADGLDRVVPGDPDNSYLMIILGQFGTDDPRIPDVGTMPQSSPLLCAEERDAIQRWIEELPAAN